MAFIIDIRQENRNLHLMYKALFASSADRADFVSRLFSRERPAGLNPNPSVRELFTAYETAAPLGSLYEANARLVRERLLDTHRFPLSPDDLRSIGYVFNAFYSDGPEIHYARSQPRDAAWPSYRSLGDFGGPSAIGRVAAYVREQRSFVAAFYSSNVEVYLSRQKMATYCGGLGALPSDSRTWLIGSKGLQPLASKLKTCAPARR